MSQRTPQSGSGRQSSATPLTQWSSQCVPRYTQSAAARRCPASAPLTSSAGSGRSHTCAGARRRRICAQRAVAQVDAGPRGSWSPAPRGGAVVAATESRRPGPVADITNSAKRIVVGDSVPTPSASAAAAAPRSPGTDDDGRRPRAGARRRRERGRRWPAAQRRRHRTERGRTTAAAILRATRLRVLNARRLKLKRLLLSIDNKSRFPAAATGFAWLTAAVMSSSLGSLYAGHQEKPSVGADAAGDVAQARDGLICSSATSTICSSRSVRSRASRR